MPKKKNRNPFKQPYQIRIPLERVQKLIDALTEGMPLKYACDISMILPQVIQKWYKSFDDFIAKWEADENSVDISIIEPPIDKNDKLIFEKLNTLSAVVVIKNARAKYMKQLNVDLKKAKSGSEQWQKYAWLLERCYRDVYGKDEPIDKSNEKIESVKITYVDPKTETDRLAKLEKEVKEAIND